MANMSNNVGSFVPTTNIWDVSEILEAEGISEDLKEIMIRLYQNLNRMSLALNTKDSGFYVTANEFVTGQVYFPNPTLSSATQQTPSMRQTYRLVINFGALPNAGVKSVPHNLTPNGAFTFTRIYGAASDPVGLTYIPLPFASPTLNANIQLDVDATNVTITTGVDFSAYTVTYIILEFMKQ